MADTFVLRPGCLLCINTFTFNKAHIVSYHLASAIFMFCNWTIYSTLLRITFLKRELLKADNCFHNFSLLHCWKKKIIIFHIPHFGLKYNYLALCRTINSLINFVIAFSMIYTHIWRLTIIFFFLAVWTNWLCFPGTINYKSLVLFHLVLKDKSVISDANIWIVS